MLASAQQVENIILHLDIGCCSKVCVLSRRSSLSLHVFSQESRLCWIASSSSKICKKSREKLWLDTYFSHKNQCHLQEERICLITYRSSPQVAVLTELWVLLRQKASGSVCFRPSDMFGLLILIRCIKWKCWIIQMSNSKSWLWFGVLLPSWQTDTQVCIAA